MKFKEKISKYLHRARKKILINPLRDKELEEALNLNDLLSEEYENIIDTYIKNSEFALKAEQDKVAKLQKTINEVHSWAVCAIISSDEDMMQNIDRIVEITTPKYEG